MGPRTCVHRWVIKVILLLSSLPLHATGQQCERPGDKTVMESQKDQSESKNVLGQPLEECGCNPLTGFYRDGFCKTDSHDFGSHTVCAVMTDQFLNFTKGRGNDLSNPAPQYGFPGLKSGDRWCLCVSRWKEAYEAGVAPPVILEATHERALRIVGGQATKFIISSR